MRVRLDPAIRELCFIEGFGVESLSLIRSRTGGDVAAADVLRYLPRRPFFAVRVSCAVLPPGVCPGGGRVPEEVADSMGVILEGGREIAPRF